MKTDLYQIVMMAAEFCNGLHKKIVSCEAFARTMPASRKFLVMAGTDEIREYLINLRFTNDDVKFLREVPMLKEVMSHSNFDQYLLDFKFTGDMWSMAEGEIVFAGEPLVRITAPLPQAHMAETFVLSVLNHDIKVASKAARIVLAARGKPVFEFGTRRHHHEAAVSAARSAYLAGFEATSNVEAGQRYGVPIVGTMAHMWVMINESEKASFANFRNVYGRSTILIDTNDTLEGARLVSEMGRVGAVRLDSGDLKELSRQVRNILDSNGKQDVKIMVSNDLDEYKIYDMEKDNSPIDSYAVGTELVVSRDAPSLGIVYKVVYDHDNDRPLVKTSNNKATLPGVKQVYFDQSGESWTHLVAIDGAVEKCRLWPLLDCCIKDGKVVEEVVVDLQTSRNYCNSSMRNLHRDLASLEIVECSVPVVPHSSLKDMFSRAIDV